jgi:hypothetical protein
MVWTKSATRHRDLEECTLSAILAEILAVCAESWYLGLLVDRVSPFESFPEARCYILSVFCHGNTSSFFVLYQRSICLLREPLGRPPRESVVIQHRAEQAARYWMRARIHTANREQRCEIVHKAAKVLHGMNRFGLAWLTQDDFQYLHMHQDRCKMACLVHLRGSAYVF